MPDIIKNTSREKIEHCGNCDRLISVLCSTGINSIQSLPFPCFYKADDINKYLLQCIMERYKEKDKSYIKHTIISDSKYDHYNMNYVPENYELKDFIENGDTNVYLVNGEAGIGKSTFLSEMYYEIALHSLVGKCDFVPIMIKMEDFGSDDSIPKNWLKKQLEEKYKYIDFEPAFFNPDICVVFFLDAVNDIQYLDYDDFKEKLNAWGHFIEYSFSTYSNIKFVISSRYLENLSYFETQNYTKLYIQPYDNNQIYAFINENCNKSVKTELLEIIDKNRELPFLGNPFFLNKLVSSDKNGIENRTEIINAFLDAIIVNSNAFVRNRKKEISVNGFTYIDVRLNGTTFFDALSYIAFMNQKANKMEIAKEEIERTVHEDTEQFIDLANNSSILTRKFFKFTHPILQEYFAGRYIFCNLQEDYVIEDLLFLDDEIRLAQSLKHVYNLIKEKKRFIELLIHNRKLILAAECVLEDMKSELKDMVTNAIIMYLSQESNTIQESYKLGFLLGKLGDVRIGLGFKTESIIEPKVVTIASNTNLKVGIYPVTNMEYSYFIADGGYSNKEFWESLDYVNWIDSDIRIKSICDFWNNIQDKLNNNSKRFFEFCKKNKFDKELIAHLCFFKKIPKKDFELIIKDLYSEEKNLKPLMWDIPTYNNPSQPVVGISIYEAFAYCCWLRKKTQKHYRLLTNEEWELVAEKEHKAYIYGNTVNTNISNTIESNINLNLPVGICKYNVSKDGVFDLTGNIFEWTSTVYGDRTDAIFQQYICKGGSWIHEASRATSGYIGRGMGWVRNLDLGFRVCYDEN